MQARFLCHCSSCCFCGSRLFRQLRSLRPSQRNYGRQLVRLRGVGVRASLRVTFSTPPESLAPDRQPVGGRARDPLQILQELGYTYYIDDVSRDEPFLVNVRNKPFAVVPYTLHMNDIVNYETRYFSTEAQRQGKREEIAGYEQERSRS
jgi:hypothetical protein